MAIPTSDGRRFEVHNFTATVSGGELAPGDDADDADDARCITAADLGEFPLAANLADYLCGAGIPT
ncbi:hypothetical protein [Pseudoclavibacter helvolus]|uniref:hypothetical protein n=1 Tax=Pseudoclavibacter helvolus TaxID=255205 RepID=UPI0024ADBB69|nr:hypothetical protein [Pseudoclavibacter helvolus]